MCVYIIFFADKFKPSTDKFPSYYINVKYLKKSEKTCDDPKPFPKRLRQIACVGFVVSSRVLARFFTLRDTGRNRARQLFLSVKENNT